MSQRSHGQRRWGKFSICCIHLQHNKFWTRLLFIEHSTNYFTKTSSIRKSDMGGAVASKRVVLVGSSIRKSDIGVAVASDRVIQMRFPRNSYSPIVLCH